MKQQRLRNNIQGITKGAIERLARKAGVYRLSALMYQEIRGIIKVLLDKIIGYTITFVIHDRAKRVSEQHVRKALKIAGHEVAETDTTTKVRRALGLNSPARTVRSPLGQPFSTCGAKPYTGPRAQSPGRSPIRFKPGTQTRRQIRFYQKQSSCFSIAMAAFERLVRESVEDHRGKNLQFSPQALELLQFAVENHIINLLEDAVDISLNAKRKTVYPRDIQVVRKMRKRYSGCSQNV